MKKKNIREALQDGLLCFPITDMDASGAIDLVGYRKRIRWLLGHQPSAIFVAGGTGEFFSLSADEFQGLVKVAAEEVDGQVPIIASAGRSVVDAQHHIELADAAGADSILLMPPYLTACPTAGLMKYVDAILASSPLPVIYYNRSTGVLDAFSLLTLAEKHDNLIGLKDGTSNMQELNLIIRTLGSRLSYIGGAPTAEIISEAYLAIGVNTYSSAVFNFIPDTASRFYHSLRNGNQEEVRRLLHSFFIPFVRLRDTKRGYAVSLIKAGAQLVGHGGGEVRPPLQMPTDEEVAYLNRLISAL